VGALLPRRLHLLWRRAVGWPRRNSFPHNGRPARIWWTVPRGKPKLHQPRPHVCCSWSTDAGSSHDSPPLEHARAFVESIHCSANAFDCLWLRAVDRMTADPCHLAIASALSLLMLAASGCAHSECEELETLVLDQDFRRSMVDWSDRWAFSAELDSDNFRMGNLSGPGRYGDSIDLGALGAILPEGMEGAEVRIISGERTRPDAIFVGYRRFQGIVVGREELQNSLVRSRVDVNAIDGVGKRIAVLCSTEEGILPIVQ
jgi:hypothetical protein